MNKNILLACRDAVIGYDNTVAVNGVSFELERGDYLCIVGENGSGKSTLLKGILGLIPMRGGSVDFADGLRRTDIGYLPQQTQAQRDFPATVREVVLSGCLNGSKGPFYSRADRSLANKNMEKLSITNIANRSYRELSGGQQQRVLLARALCAAKELDIPICQDTGMAVIFAKIGQDVHFVGGSFKDAVNAGVAKGYTEGYLRKSVVADPLRRVNTGDNTPAVLHIELVEGDKVELTVAPKGFGSENMSALKMFTPSASREDIIDYVVDVVRRAGSNPCPPMVIGVGIGGDFEQCALLAKKALCRPVSEPNADEYYAAMESEILEKANALNIGPQGFGGKTTALSAAVEFAPTHIAGLPVAVNIGCHVTRHVTVVV